MMSTRFNQSFLAFLLPALLAASFADPAPAKAEERILEAACFQWVFNKDSWYYVELVRGAQTGAREAELYRVRNGSGSQETEEVLLETFPVGKRSVYLRYPAMIYANNEKRFSLIMNMSKTRPFSDGLYVSAFMDAFLDGGFKGFDVFCSIIAEK